MVPDFFNGLLGTQRRSRPISQYDGLRFRAQLVVPDALRRILPARPFQFESDRSTR